MTIISPWYQLGYVIPHLYTDQDAYQFYRVAPDGMMLVTTGLNLREYSLAAVEENLPTLWDRFDLLAKKKSGSHFALRRAGGLGIGTQTHAGNFGRG